MAMLRKCGSITGSIPSLIFAVTLTLAACGGDEAGEKPAVPDSSEYRQNTYGPPDHYCDPTRSLLNAGTGTLRDPWNYDQCQSEPIAGDVIGHLPVGSGTPVDLAAPNNPRTPAFNPANSGSSGSPIVHVTKYAAVTLDTATVATNQNRTEMRHAGTPANVTCSNTGGATYGSDSRNYIIYDGFFVDMAQAPFTCDSGVITAREATGVQFKNFVIRGTNTTCESNCVIWRTNNTLDTVLSNFKAYDFHNDNTGSVTSQNGFFSAQYGDRNFLIEHFEITNTERGIFLKGSAGPGDNLNYGTIQYGIVANVSSCYQFNALSMTNRTTLQYSLCYDTAEDGGVVLSSETVPARNLTIDHVTIARVDATTVNTNGGIVTRNNGIGLDVSITNCVVDINAGQFGHAVSLLSQLPATLNHNGYYKNGGIVSYVFDGMEYLTLVSWQGAISGRDANSLELSTSPFVNRANGDFRVSNGHATKTASSTGSEIGAYATSEAIGVDRTID